MNDQKTNNEELIKLTDDGSSEEPRYIKLATGVFAIKGKIESVKDCSSYPGKEVVTYGKQDKTGDLVFILTTDFGDYTRDVYVTGKFKRDKKGNVTGWDRWQNGVHRLMVRILQDEAAISKDLSVPDHVVQKLVGKEIMIMRYQTAKEYHDKNMEIKYSINDWFNRIFHPTIDNKESMLQEWNESLEKGYPKDYDSNVAVLLEKQNAPLNNNVAPDENATNEGNDDLPF